MFLDRPLLGVGPGGFAERVEEYAARVPGLWDYQATPHNAYVQMAAEAGAVGLLAFLLFLGACLLVLVRAARGEGIARNDGSLSQDRERDRRGAQRRARGRASGEASLRRAVLCSLATLLVASLGIWPFAHGSGEAVVLVLALGFSTPSPEAP